LPPDGGTLFTTSKLRHVTLLLALMKVVKLAQPEKAAQSGRRIRRSADKTDEAVVPAGRDHAAGQTIASETVS
jgi:hypothetical protein